MRFSGKKQVNLQIWNLFYNLCRTLECVPESLNSSLRLHREGDFSKPLGDVVK